MSVTLNDANTASLSFNAPSVTAESEVILKITVTDDGGAIATQNVEITILNSIIEAEWNESNWDESNWQ